MLKGANKVYYYNFLLYVCVVIQHILYCIYLYFQTSR